MSGLKWRVQSFITYSGPPSQILTLTVEIFPLETDHALEAGTVIWSTAIQRTICPFFFTCLPRLFIGHILCHMILEPRSISPLSFVNEGFRGSSPVFFARASRRSSVMPRVVSRKCPEAISMPILIIISLKRHFR